MGSPVRHSIGPFEVLIGDGELRELRVGGVEVVRRIHVAVRHADWATIPARTTILSFEHSPESILCRTVTTHVDGDVDFVWNGHIQISADSISYEMNGSARSAFRYNRIGLVVLHPLTVAGHTAKAEGPAGHQRRSMPVLIEPRWEPTGEPRTVLGPFSRLTLGHPHGLRTSFEFEGDLFEMEDQRNWSDASFKTYSTPMLLGWQHRAEPGDEIRQRLELRVTGPPQTPRRRSRQRPKLSIGSECRAELPDLGFRAPPAADLPAEIAPILARLRPSHLRVDVRADDPGAAATVSTGVTQASRLHTGLELAVVLNRDDDGVLKFLRDIIADRRALARLLLLRPDRWPAEPVGRAVALLSGLAPQTAVGTVGAFNGVNSIPTEQLGGDAVVYALSPQVHEVDDRTLLENVDGQAHTVVTAAARHGVPVVVSPVTLRPLSAHDSALRGAAPADPRQTMPICAAWTVGSLQSLITAGAKSLTYFELFGPGGLIAGPTPTGSSGTREIYPVFHVFASLAGWADRPVHVLDGLEPGVLAGFAVEGPDGHSRALVANLTPRPQDIDVDVGSMALATLDANSPTQARRQVGWLEHALKPAISSSLQLAPYAVVIIDVR